MTIENRPRFRHQNRCTRRAGSTSKASETMFRTPRRGNDMVSDGVELGTGNKPQDAAGDTSRPEGPRGGSGRPRRRCFGGRRGGREGIDPVMETGSIGIV